MSEGEEDKQCMVAEHTYYIATTGSASLQDTTILGEFGGTGNALNAGRPSPWACDPRAVSTRRALERGSVSSVEIKYFTVPDVDLKNTVSSVDLV